MCDPRIFHFTRSEAQVIWQEAEAVLKMCLFFSPQVCPVINSVLATDDLSFFKSQHHRCACVCSCVDKGLGDYCDALAISFALPFSLLTEVNTRRMICQLCLLFLL